MTSCRWWHSHLCNDWAPEYWSTSHSGCATIASRSYQEDGITWWKYQVFVVTRLGRVGRPHQWSPVRVAVSTNPWQRERIWWHSYWAHIQRTLAAAIITTKNSSELLTQLFKISKRNPKQTNHRNLRRNYWSCPSGMIRKHKHHRP